MRLHLEVAMVRGPFHNVCNVRASKRFLSQSASRSHGEQLPIVDFSSSTPCSKRISGGDGKLWRILWRPTAQDCHFFNLMLVMIMNELSEFIYLNIFITIGVYTLADCKMKNKRNDKRMRCPSMKQWFADAENEREWSDRNDGWNERG